jgi:hypothetical protein
VNKQGRLILLALPITRRKPLMVSQYSTPVKHTFCKIDLHFLFLFSADHEPKPEDVILFKHAGVRQRLNEVEGSEFSCKSFKPFKILCRRDIAKACFYSNLKLKRLGSFSTRKCRIHLMKMKKEDIARGLGMSHKVDSSSHAGNKVLPISETTLSSSTSTDDQCGTSEKKDRLKGDKTKAMSRMKELLRWAAATRSEKGGKFIGRKVS